MKRFILSIFFLLFLSCQQKSAIDSLPYSEEEKVERFSLFRSDKSGEWRILGKTAAISPDRKKTSITDPKLTINTEKRKVLTLQTAKDGVAEFTIDEKTNRINSLTATKKVIIIQRDEKGQIVFKSTSERAVYDGKERVVILTGNPIVEQGKNKFRGEIIRYFVDDGKIVITGKVKGTVFPEEGEE
ncbi:MAG: LPS export ABC transporter periplasmic protein LptC [Candidatus Omnitrophica bacterium]|nr:LPS export ABC transporter periplasmic protein LptC [Candidatus Omnitrophota bacterium]